MHCVFPVLKLFIYSITHKPAHLFFFALQGGEKAVNTAEARLLETVLLSLKTRENHVTSFVTQRYCEPWQNCFRTGITSSLNTYLSSRLSCPAGIIRCGHHILLPWRISAFLPKVWDGRRVMEPFMSVIYLRFQCYDLGSRRSGKRQSGFTGAE